MPEDNDQDLTAGSADNGSEGDKTPALDPRIAELIDTARAEVRTEFAGQVSELSRTVGRAQSLAEKANATPDPDPALQEQLGSVSSILDALVDGLDPEAIPPELRARVGALRQTARAAADRRAIVAEVTEALKPEDTVVSTSQNDGAATSVQDQLNAFSTELESQIRAFDMDPNDELFDWAKMNQLLGKAGGAAEVRKYVAAQIQEGLGSDGADERRTRRAGDAGKAPVGGNGASGSGERTLSEVLNDGKLDLNQKVAAMKAAIRQ